MEFDVSQRTIVLSAREFAEFTMGPLRAGSARADPWRAQLGQIWHTELRQQLAQQDATARFEVPLDAAMEFRGWRVRLGGRLDQLVWRAGIAIVREVKTVQHALPAAEEDLRAEYADYFRQLAVYQALFNPENLGEEQILEADNRARASIGLTAPNDGKGLAGELVFVEPATGVVQVIEQPADLAAQLFQERLEELWGFAEQRRSGLERLRTLRFAPAFPSPRAGQETILQDLRDAATRSPVVLFEAPTGFGKTGCALEYALSELAAGRVTRLLYLTGKSTGQLQVVRQLDAMLGQPAGATWWQIRNKSEHCVNEVYHCFRDTCRFLDGQEQRWPLSGLQRFGQEPALPHDLDTLREAGRHEQICPYEITRAALPFVDIWVGDYNYVFAPANRSFLDNLPGFIPEQTLLIIDEAHNLPARVADSHSTELTHTAARVVLAALDATDAPSPLIAAWERFTLFLAGLQPADALDDLTAADLADHLATVAGQLQVGALDYAALGPAVTDMLFQIAGLHASTTQNSRELPELTWTPERGVLRFTCLDAAAAIAEALQHFGQVLFLSATLSPINVFSRLCGFDRLVITPAHVVARTPWRDEAYTVAIDARVDTRYQHRAAFAPLTARTLAEFQASSTGPVAGFLPSYTYAENIRRLLDADHPQVRAVLQPRLRDLAEQQAFLEEALVVADIILLVLGSSFAESIDFLGGRIAGAVVVGPALPEVNAVQEAKLDASRAANRHAAFHEVYQLPGIQKVNQALGRLVRAPVQRARVLLHCKRFAEGDYRKLLAPEYREAVVLRDDEEFASWLAQT